MNSNSITNGARFLFLLVSTFIVGLSEDALATTNICGGLTGLTIIAGEYSQDTAHLVSIASNSSCTAFCGTYKRAYIEFADKEMFALALSATMKNQSVTMAVENSAPSKGAVVHGSVTCKVVSLWLTGGQP